MKLKNYPGIVSWPPLPGGAFAGYEAFPVDQKVMVTEVSPVIDEFVTFTCEFHGTQSSYDLHMVDKATAEEFARLLNRHVGKTLEQFGEFRLDV
jgi:hypothetical protein